MSPLAAFVALLAVHWVADFVLQTHWQASNKSKDNVALARHVLVYTCCIAAASFVLLELPGTTRGAQWLLFVWFNGCLHYATDYCTSRWSSRFFAPAVRDLHKVMMYTENYGHPPDTANMRIMDLDPGRHFHNFFVVIGFDQLIHQATLALTMWAFFYAW